MTFPEIKLVDSPSAAATVLFDFNDTTASPKREVHADGFTIGVPELVGDVDAVDPMYGERLVSFTSAMTGTKSQVAAAQSTLARLLLAPGQGWLWVRMTPTSRLLFFRTYRPQPGDLSFDLLQTTSSTKAERWELKVDLPCERFAYGERITQVAQTVYGDPSSATNPCRIILPSITGDAPTRLRFSLSPSISFAPGGDRMMVNVHAGTSTEPPVSVPIGSSDGWSGLDATVVTESGYAGGSNRESTFAFAGMAERLSKTVSLTPGRYRALVRINISTPGVFQLRIESTGQVVTVQVGGAMWVDLGDVNYPARLPLSLADVGPTVSARVSLQAARVSGTATLKWDHLLLIPVDLAGTLSSKTMVVQTNTTLTAAQTATWDGDSEDAWTKDTTSGALQDRGAPALIGVFPEAVPGAAHVATFVNTVAPASGDLILRNLSVTVSYHPRFLYVGDS